MSVFEHAGDTKPEWWEPGMSAEDIAVWEAAARAAAAAHELTPADDVYLALRPLLAGALVAHAREERGAA